MKPITSPLFEETSIGRHRVTAFIRTCSCDIGSYLRLWRRWDGLAGCLNNDHNQRVDWNNTDANHGVWLWQWIDTQFAYANSDT